MSKMNPDVKSLWVAALRSGDYAQGRYMLRPTPTTFCCWGVLCNLHAQAHPTIAEKQEGWNTYMGVSGLPPPGVLTWAGIDANAVITDADGHRDFLASHNDGSGTCKRKTFLQIADAIEAQL